MHHYFEAITNKSGDSLPGYFARVVDPATQNTVTLAADNNGTPIVTTSGVENAAKTDENGNVSFYVAPGTYHLDIYAQNATSFIMRVPNVAMNSGRGPQGEQGDQGPQGEGLEAVMEPTGSALVGFLKAAPGAVPTSVLDELASAPYRPEQFGAVGDGLANDAVAFQKCADAIVGSGKRGVIRLSMGKEYKISSPVTLDVSFISFDGNGASIFAPSGAFIVTGSLDFPYDQACNSIANVRIVGPGNYPELGPGVTGAGTSKGIVFRGAENTAKGPQHVKIINLECKWFDVGLQYLNNGIFIEHFGCEVHHCRIGVEAIGSSTDTTEGLKYLAGNFYSCTIAVKQSDILNNGSITLEAVHIDYCGQAVLVTTGGIVVGHSIWLESDDYQDCPFKIDGPNTGNALIDLNICKFLISGDTPPSFTHIAQGQANTTISLDIGFLARCGTSSGYWYKGEGDFYVRTKRLPGSVEMPSRLRADQSLLMDGGFEAGTILDDFFVQSFDGTTQALVSRYQANATAGGAPAVALGLSSAQFRSGGQSLSFMKAGSSGSPATVSVAIPVEAGASYSGGLFIRKPGDSTGTVFVNFLWMGAHARDSFGRVSPQRVQVFQSLPFVLTTADTGWVEAKTPAVDCRAPSWAQYMLIQIDGQNWSANGQLVHIDDLDINRVG